MKELHPFRYRMFASVDLVGSTAFKSRMSSDQKAWAHLFREFFDDFPTTLAAAFSEIKPGKSKPARPMEIWKFAGDEILFQTEIECHQHAALHAVAFRDALNRYQAELQAYDLALKGTIWGAGFPCRNVEVHTRTSANAGQTLDFLGESIDLGFRIARLATRRRIPLSPDIALFILKCREEIKHCSSHMHLFVDSPESLKGIRDNRPQPSIWLDRRDGQQTTEDKLLGRNTAPDYALLLQYLEEHFGGSPGARDWPFIEKDPIEYFNTVPKETLEWRRRLAGDSLSENYSSFDVDVSAAAPSAPRLTPPPARGD